MKDFFISYNSADRDWAVWIAWVLEENKHSVVIQDWDFRPGGNFILEMQRATTEAERTVMVLSEAYLNAVYTQPEWAAAFKQDATSTDRKLLPIRVAPCKPAGMLAPLVYVDFVGKTEAEAERLLLAALKERAKPDMRPSFPESERVTASVVAYPGDSSPPSEAQVNPPMVNSSPTPSPQKLTSRERLKLIQSLNKLAKAQFEELLSALDPPSGVVPADTAPQGSRTSELLHWVEGPGGCGLPELQEILSEIIGDPR